MGNSGSSETDIVHAPKCVRSMIKYTSGNGLVSVTFIGVCFDHVSYNAGGYIDDEEKKRMIEEFTNLNSMVSRYDMGLCTKGIIEHLYGMINDIILCAIQSETMTDEGKLKDGISEADYEQKKKHFEDKFGDLRQKYALQFTKKPKIFTESNTKQIIQDAKRINNDIDSVTTQAIYKLFIKDGAVLEKYPSNYCCFVQYQNAFDVEEAFDVENFVPPRNRKESHEHKYQKQPSIESESVPPSAQQERIISA